MGLGKSIQALAYALESGSFPIVIVCPASLKWNWEREVNTHLGMQAEVLEGQKPRRVNRRAVVTPQIVIINYDILQYWVKWLLSLDPKLLIIDEAHYCANTARKRTRAVRKIAKQVEHCIALTGTPLINRPAELWSTLNIIDPKRFAHFRPFGDQYCAPQLTPWGWRYNGATNLGRLHRLLRRRLMVRRRTKDVLKDLPKNRQVTVPMELPDFKRYHDAEHDFLLWIAREKGAAAAKRAGKAEELSKWAHLKALAAELKLSLVMEWIDNFLQSSDDKLVVFGFHKAILQPIFHAHRRHAVLIDGSVTGRKRQQAVDLIQNNKQYRLCVGNFRAAGVGLNITKPKAALFVEIPWTPGEVSQCIARICRIGQTQETTTYFAIAKDTIEEKLCRIVWKKQGIFDAAIDGKAKHIKSNVFDHLLEEMK